MTDKLIEKYLGESKKRDFEKLGLVFIPKWDDFIKKNEKVIRAKMEEIEKSWSKVTVEKNRKKGYQNDLRDFRNKLIDLWSTMKNNRIRG